MAKLIGYGYKNGNWKIKSMKAVLKHEQFINLEKGNEGHIPAS
jgi:hypothetical protein